MRCVSPIEDVITVLRNYTADSQALAEYFSRKKGKIGSKSIVNNLLEIDPHPAPLPGLSHY
jgi:hypothetical protein